MIKGSKLIGTKIAAPFGWKKFKVGELFDYTRGSRLVVRNRLLGSIPFVTAGYEHSGIACKISNEEQFTFKENGITIDMFGNVFYRDYKFKADDNIIICYYKTTVSRYVNLYTVSLLRSILRNQFGYSKQFRMNSLKELVISLPVLPNFQPDFAWMEQYMKRVQEDYLKQKELSNQAEIKAYLTESHTDSLAITDADRQFLLNFEKLPRRKFKVLDFLILKNSPDVHFEQKNLPLISAGDNNHGIRSCVQTFEYCNNVITISKLGQTFYYHQSVCYTDDVLGLQLPVDSILFGIYLQTLLNNQTRQISSYGHQFRMKRLDELSLLLPTSVNDEIDVHSIEKYMRIQSKSLINKVAEALAPAGTTD